MRRSLIGLTFAVALGGHPAIAAGKLTILDKFTNQGAEVDVATYSEVNDKGVEERIALIGIADGGHRNSITFEASQLPTLIGLWRQALVSRSDQWRPVGEYVETGTADVSHLRISAGPGVRFVIESPAKGAFTSDLAPSNIDAFSADLEKARVFIGASVP